MVTMVGGSPAEGLPRFLSLLQASVKPGAVWRFRALGLLFCLEGSGLSMHRLFCLNKIVCIISIFWKNHSHNSGIVHEQPPVCEWRTHLVLFLRSFGEATMLTSLKIPTICWPFVTCSSTEKKHKNTIYHGSIMCCLRILLSTIGQSGHINRVPFSLMNLSSTRIYPSRNQCPPNWCPTKNGAWFSKHLKKSCELYRNGHPRSCARSRRSAVRAFCQRDMSKWQYPRCEPQVSYRLRYKGSFNTETFLLRFFKQQQLTFDNYWHCQYCDSQVVDISGNGHHEGL